MSIEGEEQRIKTEPPDVEGSYDKSVWLEGMATGNLGALDMEAPSSARVLHELSFG